MRAPCDQVTKRNGGSGHENGADLIMYSQTHCDVTNDVSPSSAIISASFPGKEVPGTRLKECDSKIASNFWHKRVSGDSSQFTRVTLILRSMSLDQLLAAAAVQERSPCSSSELELSWEGSTERQKSRRCTLSSTV